MPALLSKARYIQLIHIGKSSLKMGDDEYRSVLAGCTGKDSCKGMSQLELDSVLQYMKSLGFKPTAKKRPGKKLSPKTHDKDNKTQLDKLRQLWIVMGKAGHLKDSSDQALLNWSKAQVKRLNKGVAVESLEWLTSEMLNRLIEQLKQWHERCEKKVKENVS